MMNVGTTFRQWQAGSGVRLRKRQVVALAVLIAALLVIAWLSSTYKIIRPNYPASVDAAAVSVSIYDIATEKKTAVKRLSDSLLLVPRDTEALAFHTDTQESLLLAPGQSGTFGVVNLDITFKEPSSGKLISVGSDDCPVVNGNNVYSHRCSFPEGYSLYTPDAPGLEKQADSFRFNAKYTSGQYRDGVLAWSSRGKTTTTTEAEIIQYVTPEKGVVNTIELPKEVNRTEYLQLITDSTNVQNTAFVIYNYAAGVGYYYPDATSKITPKIVKRTGVFDIETSTSSCVLRGMIFSCYHGKPGEDTHEYDESGFVNESQAGGSIQQTDMGAAELETRTYRNKDGGIDELLATASGILYTRGGTTLSRVVLGSADFKLKAISRNSTIAASGTSLYYVQNNRVFSYDETTDIAMMVYDNSRQSISKLVVRNDRVLSLSYNKRDPLQLLNIYDITSKEAK